MTEKSAIQAAQPCDAGKSGRMNDEIMQMMNRTISAAENAHPIATMFSVSRPLGCMLIVPSMPAPNRLVHRSYPSSAFKPPHAERCSMAREAVVHQSDDNGGDPAEHQAECDAVEPNSYRQERMRRRRNGKKRDPCRPALRSRQVGKHERRHQTDDEQ